MLSLSVHSLHNILIFCLTNFLRMKLSLVLAFVLLVGVALAHPAKKPRPVKDEGQNEIVLNSPTPISRRRGVVDRSARWSLAARESSQNEGSSPLVYFRTPRYYEPAQYYEQQVSPVWIPGRGRSYRVYRNNLKRQQRDDEEDDDDDVTAEDDDNEDEEDEEEQNEVETPTWDEMFPPEEQGDYGQAQKNPSFGRRQSQQPQYALVGAPPQEYEGPSGVVGPPAGRARHALYEQLPRQQIRVQRRRPQVTYKVISPRQYNFDVGAPKRQSYYVGNGNRRQGSSSWNPFSSWNSKPKTNDDEPSSEESSRRPWGPATGPVFHYQEGKTSSNRYSSYPYMPTSGYQGRSNSFQGRRNNKIPVFYTQRGYY